MVIDNKFNIRDKVFLDTDTDQNERVVTGIIIRETRITYGLSCGTNESWHDDFEITTEKNVLKTTTN